MAKDCWCTLKVHLPGEKKRHQEALKQARLDLERAEGAKKAWKK